MNYISYEELKKINKVQVKILQAVDSVCRKLGITYFMVHGSLLGTVRNNGFIYGDDDIDIAIPREMYNRFLQEAPQLFDSQFFVQCYDTDSNYPLEFAKVRDCNTTYIVDVANNVKMNHGVYIDVFPIDNSISSGFIKKIVRVERKIINIRLSDFQFDNKKKLRKFVKFISCIIYPTKTRAEQRRKRLFNARKYTGYVEITGGKPSEQLLPAIWFENGTDGMFEKIKVNIPNYYDEYLTHIYGEYEKRTLIEGKTDQDGKIEINASIVSVEKPYTYYFNK